MRLSSASWKDVYVADNAALIRWRHICIKARRIYSLCGTTAASAAPRLQRLHLQQPPTNTPRTVCAPV